MTRDDHDDERALGLARSAHEKLCQLSWRLPPGSGSRLIVSESIRNLELAMMDHPGWSQHRMPVGPHEPRKDEL